ncbi:uncharacterized protein LOC117787594 [Drosophila innubila]|uniref:uncharacterized protein LOC117787594 n=1 Tax=Drosophila innubila TaxID=198719 RepID=UPI00148DB39D|nr:uncharacterized protein LOC117787594 [Drosophila innubila]
MFQNISFTFLCALAFISWTVLCYLHVVEEQKKSDDYKVEIYTERSHFADLPQYCPIKSTEANFISRAYELLLSYGLILATTVVLSKILQLLELEAISYLQREAANLAVQESFPMIGERPEAENDLKTTGLDNHVEMPPPYLQDNLELREQLDDLQARCRELLQELRAVNSSTTSNDNDLDCNPSKSSLSSSDMSTSTDNLHYDDENSSVIMWKRPTQISSSGLSVMHSYDEVTSSVTAQNVYVTHSHIHINFNGPVRLSQQNINVGTLRLKDMPKNSEFRQVWGKYLKGPNEIPMLTGINNILM